MIPVESVALEHDVVRRVHREDPVRLIPDGQALQPEVACGDANSLEQDLAVARAHPDDVVVGRPRLVELDAAAVIAGVKEHDIAWRRGSLCIAYPTERALRGTIARASARDDVQDAAGCRQHRQAA